MLSVSDLNQFYGGSHILRGLSFEVEAGRVTCLLGRNGVGKTTLMKCLMGLVKARSGSISLGPRDITHAAPHERVALGVGYVPQGREIFPRLTVEENLRMGLATRPAGAAIPGLVFELFPVLQTMLRRRGGDLSGGQQQQLAIGRALAMEPKLLILDEPTEGIQPSIIKDIGRALQFLRDEMRMTILLVEQYLDFCRELADSIYVMDRGEILHAGPASDLDRPDVKRHLTV